MKKKCRMGKRSEVYNKAAPVTADCSPTVPISLSKDRSLAQIDGVGWAADILLQFTLWLRIGMSKGLDSFRLVEWHGSQDHCHPARRGDRRKAPPGLQITATKTKT